MGAAEKIGEGQIIELENELLTAGDVAKLLRVNISTVYTKAAANEIPSRKKLGKRYFLKSEILKYIKQF